MLECRYNEGQQDETTDRISGKTYYLYSGATASVGTTSEEAKDTTESGSTDSDTSDPAGTQITLLNSKGEIQTALEEMAKMAVELLVSASKGELVPNRTTLPVSLVVRESTNKE